MSNPYKENRGIEFRLRSNDTYSLVSVPRRIEGAIAVPHTYKGKAVTKIEDYAFLECKKMTSLTIPLSVCEVGFCTFAECVSLEKVEFQGYIEIVGKSAFYDCKNLKEVDFANGVGKIAKDAFEMCEGIGCLRLEDEEYNFPERCVFDDLLEDKYFERN